MITIFLDNLIIFILIFEKNQKIIKHDKNIPFRKYYVLNKLTCKVVKKMGLRLF